MTDHSTTNLSALSEAIDRKRPVEDEMVFSNGLQGSYIPVDDSKSSFPGASEFGSEFHHLKKIKIDETLESSAPIHETEIVEISNEPHFNGNGHGNIGEHFQKIEDHDHLPAIVIPPSDDLMKAAENVQNLSAAANTQSHDNMPMIENIPEKSSNAPSLNAIVNVQGNTNFQDVSVVDTPVQYEQKPLSHNVSAVDNPLQLQQKLPSQDFHSTNTISQSFDMNTSFAQAHQVMQDIESMEGIEPSYSGQPLSPMEQDLHSPAKNMQFGGSQVSVGSSNMDSLPTQQESLGGNPHALLSLQMKWCQSVLRILKRHGDAGPFLRPVDPIALGIPDYYNIIKNPTDLSTIEKKLSSKEFSNPQDFLDEVELMLNNCFTYNPPNHPVHIMGRNVEKSFQNQIKKMPKTGDELKVDTKISKARSSSVNPSPASSRPKRDVHPPNEYWPEDLTRKKKNKRSNEELRWCATVHKELTKKSYETFMFPFYLPVDPIALNIPQYFDIIKEPMDLSTMKKKLDSGVYYNCEDYKADFKLIVNNCFTFNRPGDDVYIMGQKADELFNRKWNEKPDFNVRESSGGGGNGGNTLHALYHHNNHSTVHHTSKSKKKKTFGSDFDTSTDDEDDADNIQIQMVEQQIQLLQRQLEALRHKRRRKMEKRKDKSASRRSSKGSNMEVPAPVVEARPPPPLPPVVTEPRPPPPPKKPKGKVGRPKKSHEPPEIREITFEEKRELSEAIPVLSADKLNRVVQIIHESMPHLKDNAGEEIELDIDSLDLLTLNRLWYFVKGSKKKRTKDSDPVVNASRISELEMQLAMMDGRPDKTKRFQGLGNDSSSDSSSSDSDDSDTGSEN